LAAVMLLLYRRGGAWHVPLTQRPAKLVRHGGQISLPGGRIEPGETPDAAARFWGRCRSGTFMQAII
jgi:8-oxo-dGTP pyrophosphatase MutT (NUDIX family)